MGEGEPFVEFQNNFAHKYYPSKAYLLTLSRQEEAFRQDIRQTKKCPFCAEVILLEAVICRYCGRDVVALVQSNPSSDNADRNKLAELDRKLASYERFIKEQTLLAENAGRASTWAWIVFVIGIFLVPVGVGIIIALIAFFRASTESKKKKNAEYDISEAYKDVEELKKERATIMSRPI
jgi:hypothetical protein